VGDQTGTRTRVPRVLRILGWTVLGLILALYIGFPVAMAVAAVWPTRAAVGAPPAGFSEVKLKASDGVDLAAWYAPPKNGAAVILAHGANGSRESMRRLAVALSEHGYGVLSLDLRGHGESDGGTNRLGWQGTNDVRAAVDYLRAQDGVVSIGGVGHSMGGEVLLGASAECPQLRAIAADGATRRCTDELTSLPSERPLVRNFTARVMYTAVGLLTGEPEPAPLLDEMERAKASSYLLVAAGDVGLEVAFNRRFAEVLGERATLWVVPGVGHTGAYAKDPSGYEKGLFNFLDAHLLDCCGE